MQMKTLTIENNNIQFPTKLLESFLTFMGADKYRPNMLGLGVVLDTTRLNVVATDGHTLVRVFSDTLTEEQKQFFEARKNHLFPRDYIERAAKVAKLDKKSTVELLPSELRGDMLFPEAMRVFPSEPTIQVDGIDKVFFNARYLSRLGKIAETCAPSKKDNQQVEIVNLSGPLNPLWARVKSHDFPTIDVLIMPMRGE